jgi:hypothetical protein
VSFATQHERDVDREQYTWWRFKRERPSEQVQVRPLWQRDKLWAGALVACTLAMVWFFA